MLTATNTQGYCSARQQCWAGIVNTIALQALRVLTGKYSYTLGSAAHLDSCGVVKDIA
jgi:hypothetical protein